MRNWSRYASKKVQNAEKNTSDTYRRRGQFPLGNLKYQMYNAGLEQISLQKDAKR